MKPADMNDETIRSDGVLRQSGVIPFRFTDEGLEVLIITTSGSRSEAQPKWSIPKGKVEPGTAPQDSAVNEAFEEAGAIGRILEPAVGVYEYDKSGKPARVEVFLFEVHEILDEWLESDMRDRKWSAWEQARSSVGFEEVRDLIGRLPEFLKRFGYNPDAR